MYEVSLRLRKKMGRKVEAMGGNAIIGYKQQIEDEGEKTHKLLIRGYGTAVYISYYTDANTSVKMFKHHSTPPLQSIFYIYIYI